MTEISREIEERISRRLRVWTMGFAAVCLTAGIAFGFLLAGRFATAEDAANTRLAPETLSASFAEVTRKVEPAVVNIDTKGKVPEVSVKEDKSAPPAEGATPDDILEFFRRQLPRRPSSAVGSGFIVDRTGYILTNYHVVEDASRITVRLQNGEEYLGKIIGTDEETDIAVLKIEAGRDLPTVSFGDSEAIQVGDWVLAIGSPFGLAQSVTAGIISQTKRETPYASVFQKFIQTDAAINRGNSGGPLLNMKGEVIGVNSQIATTTGDFNGIGFALPAKEAAYVYQQILQNGKVRRGYLGVNLDSVKSEFAKVYGLTEAKGAIVTDVRDRTGAAGKAGLLAGDVIVEFGGQPVGNAQDLIGKVASTEPGKEINVVFLRETANNLERKTTVVRLGERPSNNTVGEADPPKKLPTTTQTVAQISPLGLSLAELTPSLATAYKLEGQKGVLVKSVDPASFIADVKTSAGTEAITPGDLIQRVNRQTVGDLKSFNELVGKLKTGDAVVLHIANYNRQSRSVQQRIVQFTVQ